MDDVHEVDCGKSTVTEYLLGMWKISGSVPGISQVELKGDVTDHSLTRLGCVAITLLTILATID